MMKACINTAEKADEAEEALDAIDDGHEQGEEEEPNEEDQEQGAKNDFDFSYFHMDVASNQMLIVNITASSFVSTIFESNISRLDISIWNISLLKYRLFSCLLHLADRQHRVSEVFRNTLA